MTQSAVKNFRAQVVCIYVAQNLYDKLVYTIRELVIDKSNNYARQRDLPLNSKCSLQTQNAAFYGYHSCHMFAS